MEYRVIKAENLYDLMEKVNNAISEGWEPQGGMVMEYQLHREREYSGYSYRMDSYYCQAMIKR